MPNLGELTSYIHQHNLTHPLDDGWNCFKQICRVFVDCWWHGAEPEIESEGRRMAVHVAGDLGIEMQFDTEPHVSHPLRIACVDKSTGETDHDDYTFDFVPEGE